jgi:hypothetical protein
VIAGASDASLASHGAALIVLIAHKVDLPVRAHALTSPDASRLVVVDDHVPTKGPLRSLGTDHLAEGTFVLTARASALDAVVARSAATHVTLISYIVHTPIWAGAKAAPHANVRTHLPVNDVPWLLLARMVLGPLQSVELHVRTLLPIAQLCALEHAAQDVMASA